MSFTKKKAELIKLIPGFAEELAPIYKHLRWYWQPGKKRFIPKAKDIEKTLNRLVDDLNRGHSTRTGGLCVYHDTDDRTMGIQFSIERWIHTYEEEK